MDGKLDTLQGKMESKMSEGKAETIKWMFILKYTLIISRQPFVGVHNKFQMTNTGE